MTLTIEAQPLPLRVEENGTVRIGRTRVTLDLLIEALESGDSPEEIVHHIPTLDLGDVYAVLAFYLHHRAEVAAYLAAQDAKYGEVNRMLQEQWLASDVRARYHAAARARDEAAAAARAALIATATVHGAAVPLRLDAPPNVLRRSDNGVVRVGNSCVTLDIVIGTFKQGVSPEEIAQRFPSLDLKDVYAAVTYYLYNQAEVAAYLAEQERETAEIERASRAIWEASDLYKRMKTLVAEREA